jgi:hypothetical protein
MNTTTRPTVETNAFGQPKRPPTTADKRAAAAWAPFQRPLGAPAPTGKGNPSKAAKGPSPWQR